MDLHSGRQPPRQVRVVIGILLYTAGILLCAAGCSWPDSPDGPDTSTAIPLVQDFVLIGDSKILLATDEGKLMKSDNGGCSWREVNGAGCPRPGFTLVFWNMTNGEGESVWTLWWELHHPGFDVRHRSGLGVSHDGGETFRIFDRDELQFGVRIFFEVPDEHPLFVNGRGEFLRVEEPDSPWLSRVLVPWGDAPPEGRLATAAVCEDRVIVAMIEDIDAPGVLVGLWSSSDSGQTWTREREGLPAMDHQKMTCGPGKDAWSIWTEDILHYDTDSGVWRTVVQLPELTFSPGPIQSIPSIASDGTRLFVGAATDRPEPILFSVWPDGTVEELPPMPQSGDGGGGGVFRIRVDHEGTLWVASRGLFKFLEESATWDRVWPKP